ncbi:hypothetical protein GW916_09845 [bacterium]|nr:hypothetical protein [bacterium]
MIKWLVTAAIGVVTLSYIGYASYNDIGSSEAISVIVLFMMAFGAALALSFMERPFGRKSQMASARKLQLESKH